ncbi:MAG: 4Fe-4S dicluster domain-containing protein [Elusimicrobiales bacterium]|nr:4Fe-4S dicluster domain-containing protein [Elusimicrobiales bacterium]
MNSSSGDKEKGLTRRAFIKNTVGIAAGLTSLPALAQAKPENILSPDRMGVLVDTTVCIGCRNCEWGCKTSHGLPTPPLETYEDASVFEKMRRPDDKALTVVNSYPNPKDPKAPYTVKVQCMHCDHPACVSACIVGALSKEESGSVIWDTGKCIGCRYCIVACPFQIPAFEYYQALQPEIRKCDFCSGRRKDGKLPACVESCPAEALTYGPREELVRIARNRVKRYPQRYVNYVYGEYEVGGTSWLYLAGRDFADLQFPKLGKNPAPGVSESIQHGIFAYFVPPVALYGLLGLLMWVSKNNSDEGGPK